MLYFPGAGINSLVAVFCYPQVRKTRSAISTDYLRTNNCAHSTETGGKGRWTGGDGLNRTIRFLSPMEVSFLCGRRMIPPSGLQGGGDGQTGRNAIRHIDKTIRELLGRIQFECEAGEAVIIQTPSGGGYG